MSNIEIIKLSKVGCRPCFVLSNVLNEVELNGATLTEVNITHTPEAIDKYAITSVPVLVFEKDGKEVARREGLTSADEIQSILKEVEGLSD